MIQTHYSLPTLNFDALKNNETDIALGAEKVVRRGYTMINKANEKSLYIYLIFFGKVWMFLNFLK